MNGAFRLGVRLGRYQRIRSVITALERVGTATAKVLRWALITVVIVVGLAVFMALIAQLNYAPLWIRTYTLCVDAQPDAPSISQAIRTRTECARLASSVVEQQPK